MADARRGALCATQQERAERVEADTQLCDSARSLGELAASLGAQQETYDALKLSFATGVVTDNVGQSQLQSGQAEYDADSEKLGRGQGTVCRRAGAARAGQGRLRRRTGETCRGEGGIRRRTGAAG